MSGHTHGGQVQLPLFGPLITPPHGEKYTEGLYSISPTFSLYVNRGLGTTRLPYRFLSRPEITVYTLFNKNIEED
jgi:predicted MPP superfamily phosphohydrolase